MKVVEYVATGTDVSITLEPEHAAEIALFQLLAGCSAKFETGVESPKDGAIITATVKVQRGY